MTVEEEAKLKLIRENHRDETRIKDQKYVLLPILDALGIQRKFWEEFRFLPDQMVGLIISSIKQLEQTRNRLVRRNIELVQQKEKRGQEVLDFMGYFKNDGGKP